MARAEWFSEQVINSPEYCVNLALFTDVKNSNELRKLIVEGALEAALLNASMNLYAPDPDPELHVEHYERTQEHNDELGISDMKTEDYMGNS